MSFLIFYTFLAEFYFFISTFFIFFFGITYTLSSIFNFPKFYDEMIYFSSLTLIYTFLLLFNNNVYLFNSSFLLKTESNIYIEYFFILLTLFILLVSFFYNNKFHLESVEYVVLLLLSLGSFLMFLNVVNLVYIYLIIEIQSIIVSLLISLNKNNRFSIESSIKYFILGSYSSLLFLFGTTLLYGSTGFVSIYNLSMFFEGFHTIENDIVLFSITFASIFLLVGLLFKIYSAPFHFWLPEIYEATPTSILIYISTIQLLAMVIFFIKIFYYVLYDILKLKDFLISTLSILTLVLGSIGALYQINIKQLMSYSTITVNGFFLFSIYNFNLVLLESSLMYMFIYTLMSFLLFILLLNFFFNNKMIVKVTDLFNIYHINKVLTLFFLILFFTFTGMPPFLIFIGKLFLIKSFFYESLLGVFFLFIILLLSNFYYVRFIKNIYYNIDNDNNLISLSYKSYLSIWCLFFLFIILLYCFINNSYLFIHIKLFLYSIINA